jgi:hypothetical protein
MAAVTYTAKRRLISGHTASTQYSLDIELAEIVASDNASAAAHVALSGNTETVFNRLDTVYQCTTTAVDNDGRDELREFLGSAVDGHYITFDAYGTVASPDDAQTAVLTSKNHQPTRLGNVDLWTFNFSVRIIE